RRGAEARRGRRDHRCAALRRARRRNPRGLRRAVLRRGSKGPSVGEPQARHLGRADEGKPAAPRRRPLLPRPGARDLPYRKVEGAEPPRQNGGGRLARDHPPDGCRRRRHHRSARYFSVRGRGSRGSHSCAPFREARPDAPRGHRVAEKLPAPRGDRGAAQGDPRLLPAAMNAPELKIVSRVREGLPYPRGASWDGNGVNFAVYSGHATKVELCLFDSSGRETERIELPEYRDETWHGYVPDLRPGQVYGYRVHGPYAPEEGHRFNPNKLVLDPYARAHIGELKWDPAVFAYKV